MTKKIKVLLADDHSLMLASLKLLLKQESDIAVIGQALTGEEAVKLAKEKIPDVILMDINMPGMGGMEATRRIVHTLPEIKVIILSSYDVSPYPYQLMKMGAKGFLSKDCGPEEVAKSIRRVWQGYNYISEEVALKLALESTGNRNRLNDNPPDANNSLEQEALLFQRLSRREMQIFILIGKGLSVKEIASGFSVSAKDINGHRYKIFKKLNIKTDVQLAHLAIRHNLVECKATL